MRKLIVVAMLAALTLVLAGCPNEDTKDNAQFKSVNQSAKKRRAYIPTHNVEFNNYNEAQKVYDSPSTIIWCSTTWGNPSAPIVTVPIAGKLTSSSVSFFPTQRAGTGGGDSVDYYTPENRSVDGMYHGNPPPYRYGFTPGGQYVDFFNMPTVCTTAMSKFQRQKTAVTTQVDPEAASATREAEAALRAGDKAKAQRALERIGSAQAGG